MKTNTPLQRYTSLKSTGFAYSKALPSTLQVKQGFRSVRKYLKKSSNSDMVVLDRIFSEVVRRKHADYRGMVSCVTCWAKFHWKLIQAGHFIDRQHLLTRYDETAVFPQCENCNCFMEKTEMLEKYGTFLILNFGPEYPEFLRQKAKGDAHGFPFKELIAKYTEERDTMHLLQDNEIQY